MIEGQWFSGWAEDKHGHPVDESSHEATRWGVWAWIHRHLGGKKKMDCPSVVVPFIDGLVRNAIKHVAADDQDLSVDEWHVDPTLEEVNAVIDHVEAALNVIVFASTAKPVSREPGTLVIVSASLEEICMLSGVMRALIKQHNLGGDSSAVMIAELLEEACDSAKNLTLQEEKAPDMSHDQPHDARPWQ